MPPRYQVRVREYATDKAGRKPRGPGLSESVNPALLMRRYQTSVPATSTREELAGIMREMADWAVFIHAQLSEDDHPGNIEATATYSTVITAINNLLTKNVGSGIKAADLGRPDAEAIADLKLRYSRVIGGNMTKMKSAVDYLQRLKGDIYQHADEKHPEREGVVLPWIARPMPKLIASTVSIAEDWMRLLVLETKMQAKGSKYHEKREALIVESAARSADGDQPS